MKNYINIILVGFFLLGCQEQKVNYNGKELTQKYCQKCHNLDIPPKLSDKELAPPMMAIVFHIKDIQSKNPDSLKSRFVDFIISYSLNPSEDKAMCDKGTIKQYNLMPKQNISKDKLKAIANYLWITYDAKKFFKEQREKELYNRLPKGQKLLIKYNCLSCHKIKYPFDKTKTKNQLKDYFYNKHPIKYNIKKQDINIIIDYIKNK